MCVIHSILAGMHPWGLVEMNCPHLRVRSLRMKLKSLSSSSESPVVYYKSPLPYHMYGRPGLWGSSGRSPTVGLPFSEFVIPPPPKQPRIDQDNVSDVGSSTYSSHFPDPALMGLRDLVLNVNAHTQAAFASLNISVQNISTEMLDQLTLRPVLKKKKRTRRSRHASRCYIWGSTWKQKKHSYTIFGTARTATRCRAKE